MGTKPPGQANHRRPRALEAVGDLGHIGLVESGGVGRAAGRCAGAGRCCVQENARGADWEGCRRKHLLEFHRRLLGVYGTRHGATQGEEKYQEKDRRQRKRVECGVHLLGGSAGASGKVEKTKPQQCATNKACGTSRKRSDRKDARERRGVETCGGKADEAVCGSSQAFLAHCNQGVRAGDSREVGGGAAAERGGRRGATGGGAGESKES